MGLLTLNRCNSMSGMGAALEIKLPEPENMGPAMKALTEKQRAFVVAYFHTGSRMKATAAAGYAMGTPDSSQGRVMAWQVWHSAKVQAAIKEFASENVLSTLVPMAMKAWEEIIDDPSHKDRAKAVGMVLDRTGMHAKMETVHTVTENREERVLKIIRICKELGMDPKKFIGGASDFVDADFEVVQREEAKLVDISPVFASAEASDPEHSTDGLEDIL